MIIIGYQGIGKSTLAGKHNCIDLESGNFFVDGVRDENWYKMYVQIATHLSEQGYIVFVSSHKVVREELANVHQSVWCVFPQHQLKYQWIAKLEERYKKTKLPKDERAYLNAKECYSQNVEDLATDIFATCAIGTMDYSLIDIIRIIEANANVGYQHFTSIGSAYNTINSSHNMN